MIECFLHTSIRPSLCLYNIMYFILYLCAGLRVDQISCGLVIVKMKIISSFTHPQVVPTLYEFLSFVEHKIRYFE